MSREFLLMKKVFLFLFFSSLTLLFGANHLSVPIEHRAYDILLSAEIRGLINPISSVKPYTKSIIIENLNTLLNNNKINKSELKEISSIIDELKESYESPNKFTELLKQGSYSSFENKYKIGIRFGVNSELVFAHSLSTKNAIDSRNAIRAYMSGNVLNNFSFYMDFGFRLDRIDTRLFIPNDFTLPSEGKYDSLFSKASDLRLYYGIDMQPELAATFLENKIQFRWGSFKRDWGVAHNNLMISGSARPFDAIELSLKLAPWLDYQFITGSLGMFWVTKYLTDGAQHNEDYFDEYHFSDGMQGTKNMNNFSAHRLELKFPLNLTFGIYESVVYRKRFELGYLNPFSILMFQQNVIGDFDNVLAGVDLQWKLPGYLKIYGTLATTEMNEIRPDKFFKAPRNVMSFQGGADAYLPFGSFTTLTFQYTYVGPFFYTHYPIKLDYNSDEEPDEIYELMYVNKGENLGYPLRPNSDEFLIKLTTGFLETWNISATIKYQRRSGQYGFNIDKYLVYKAASLYDDKNFSENLFEQLVGLDLSIEKKFNNYPIKLKATYIYYMQTKRELTATVFWDTKNKEEFIEGVSDENDRYPIQYSVSGPWSIPTHNHAFQIGVHFWR